MRVCVCVGACARVHRCACACARGRDFVSRFFSRGCVRVGVCACACARVGGVRCKAAGTFAHRHERWICTIHHEHKEIHHEHKEINGLSYLSPSYLVASYLSPVPFPSYLPQLLSPRLPCCRLHLSMLPLPFTLLSGCLSFGCSLGISLAAGEIIDGVGV